MRYVVVVAILMAASAGAALQTTSALPANATADWGNKPDRRAWTDATYRAVSDLGAPLWREGFTPAGIHAYCPNYASGTEENRRLFWVGLLSRLARTESSFNPALAYEEPFNDSAGRPVISRGLLQISIESANQARYNCEIRRAEELHDPATNLSCAVRIMTAWVPRDGVIWGGTSGKWRGAARYWSPFRKPDERVKIANWTKTQPYCALP